MNFSKTRNVKTPNRANTGDGGIDFFFPEDLKAGEIKVGSIPYNESSPELFKPQADDVVTEITIFPGFDVLIPSGIKVDVPFGTALIAFNKSGVALKSKLVKGAQVIDHGYQGEVHLHLINYSSGVVTIKPGQKLIQFIHIPVILEQWNEKEEDELFNSETTRGAGGFGSTGTN